MATGILCTYELEQVSNGWIVRGGPGDEAHVFLELASALSHLSELARANACVEHDSAGRPIGEP